MFGRHENFFLFVNRSKLFRHFFICVTPGPDVGSDFHSTKDEWDISVHYTLVRVLVPAPSAAPLPFVLSPFSSPPFLLWLYGCLSPCLLTLFLSRCLSVDSISTGYSHSTETTGLFNRLTYNIAGRASSIRLQPLHCLGSPSQPSE